MLIAMGWKKHKMKVSKHRSPSSPMKATSVPGFFPPEDEPGHRVNPNEVAKAAYDMGMHLFYLSFPGQYVDETAPEFDPALLSMERRLVMAQNREEALKFVSTGVSIRPSKHPQSFFDKYLHPYTPPGR